LPVQVNDVSGDELVIALVRGGNVTVADHDEVAEAGTALPLQFVDLQVGDCRSDHVQRVAAGSVQEHSFCDLPTVPSPRMVVVPRGDFMMGALDGESGSRSHERPRHRVEILSPFAVSQFAVTFEEWDAAYKLGAVKHYPSDFGWGRGRRPVVDVSWHDAQAAMYRQLKFRLQVRHGYL
jgi:formylglycine-generating enzyme required for sulfatase activity